MLMRNKTRLGILTFLDEHKCESVSLVDDGLKYRVDFNDGKMAYIDRESGEIIRMVMTDRKTEIIIGETPGYKGAIHEISSRLRNLDTTMKRSIGVYDRGDQPRKNRDEPENDYIAVEPADS